MTVYDIFDQFETANCQITLIENVECVSKDELLARERHYIKTMECVNKCIPLRTAKEYSFDNRERYRKYYHEHKDQKVAYDKQYMIENREKIKVRRAKTYVCECGMQAVQYSKAQHNRTKKHISFINQNNQIDV